MDKIKITFLPGKETVEVPAGITIKEAAVLAGIIIDSPCGGQGTCGKCKVEIISGNAPVPHAADKKFIHENELQKGYRLSCLAKVHSDTTVTVPKKAQLDRKKILLSGPKRKVDLDPDVNKIFLQLEPQTITNQLADEELVRKALGDKKNSMHVPLDCIRVLPKTLRDSISISPYPNVPPDTNYKITAVINSSGLIDVELGNTINHKYGIAVDIGTTSVVAILADLNTGKTVHIVSEHNSQAQFGADVISRILYVIDNPETGLAKLQHEIINVINKMITELCSAANIEPRAIYDMTIVGNTTMQHLFLGVTPKHLAFSPYICASKHPVTVNAAQLNINIHPRANVYVFPNIAGFIGGDTVGVILALNMHKETEIKLAIDIGTNGELALGNKDKLLTASCAAGPAFEGAQISHGMRAIPGAIESVFIADEGLFWRVIGHEQAIGICGSGLVDITAELVKLGIIDMVGRIRNKSDFKGKISNLLVDSIIEDETNGNSFIVAESKEKRVLLTQRDVRELQLAKGAILAGIEILKKEMGITNDDITEIYIAGTFGNYIDKHNAKAIGLIPEYPLEKVKFVGNAAAEGARLGLISRQEKIELQKILEITRYVEISGRPDFQEEFATALLFPEP
jgi:uncharacterized 2Fe-2S/4Fe-4S cluster protein (DUF4445 family)